MVPKRGAVLVVLGGVILAALFNSHNSFVGPLQRLSSSSAAAKVAEVLIRDGVVVIENRASPATMAAAVKELDEGRMADGRNVRFGAATQLLKNPLDPEKEPALKSLAEDPLILEAAELARREHGKGSDRGIVWELRQLILQPGFPAGPMHRDVVDSSSVPLERPLQWGMNTIWATHNFTVENGATRFVPGSHSSRAPQGSWTAENEEAGKAAIPAAMPAGSVVIYYASVLHGSGDNQSPDFRTGLNFNYAFVDENGMRPAGWGW